ARMSYAGVRRRLPDGEHLRPRSWDGRDGPVEGDLHPRLLAASLITTPALVVERALFEEAGGFDERLRYHEDWDLVVRLSARTRVAAVKDWLVESARGPDSLSADRAAYLDSLALLAENHEPFLRAHPRVHERRLADAGFLLVVGRRPQTGWPLVRKALGVRPWSLHGPLLRSGGAIVRGRVRSLARRRLGRMRARAGPGATGRQT
ncbi:MAG: hypothetical protein QOC71_139, partial [Thermoplasmata archaeon]|nr:hypothetical protein [Thermoplasmata archaeon]